MKKVEEKRRKGNEEIVISNFQTKTLKRHFQPNQLLRRFILVFSPILLLFFITFNLFAQDLPDEIRGYKVQKANISVTNIADKSKDKDKSEAFARLTEPELTDTSLTGLTFEISAEIDALDYKGKIDFLTFNDFKINDLKVNVEEYTNAFEFKKNEVIKLPKPIKIFLATGQILKGALGEATDSKDEWTVTGKVFVFGRFKKFGFDFKRVVPVEVNVKIKNPIKKGSVLPDIVPSIL
jgi:hypothetical protein